MAFADISTMVEAMDDVSIFAKKPEKAESLSGLPEKKFLLLCINLWRGGTERQISYISSMPTCKKIICLARPEPFFDTGRLEVVALSQHTKDTGTLAWLLSLPLMFYKLVKEIRKENSLPVVSFLDKANLFNILARPFTHHRCIINIRTDIVQYYSDSGIKKAVLQLLSFFYRKADAIVFNSVHAARRYQDFMGSHQLPVKVIGNAFPLHSIRTKAVQPLAPEVKAIFASKKVVVTVGNTHIFKGHWYLLRIFAAVKARIPDAALMILGDGDMYAPLVQLAGELGLEVYDAKTGEPPGAAKDVYFFGQQANPFPFVHHANLFVLTSILEGSPNVLNEALICGKRVVAPDCNSGPKEILAPELLYSERLRQPYSTPFGTLMPPFEGGVVMDTSPLGTVEQQWVQVLQQELNASAPQAESEKYRLLDVRLDQETVLKQWQTFVNG